MELNTGHDVSLKNLSNIILIYVPCIFFLFCTMTNKWTIISHIITLLNVSTLSCHPQRACNEYLNYKLYYQQLHLKYCVTWQDIDYKLPEDDTIVSKHVGVW
jgi:hypothetical protein